MMTQPSTNIHLPAPTLTPLQWSCVGFQLVLLTLVAALSLLINDDNFRLLWNDPLGVKMTVGAGVFMLVNLLAFVGGSMLLNRLTVADRSMRPKILSMALAV